MNMLRRTFLTASSSLLLPAAWAADPTWAEFAQQGLDYTGGTSRELESVHKFSQLPEWRLLLDAGEMHFFKPQEKPLVAKIQVVGTMSRSQWKWSWADTTLKPNVTKEMEKLKAYGAQRKFPALTEPTWQGEEKDAWLMTAMANLLLKGKGVYRPPVGGNLLFVIFTSVQRAA